MPGGWAPRARPSWQLSEGLSLGCFERPCLGQGPFSCLLWGLRAFGRGRRSGAVRRIRISAEFNGIAWSRWGSAPCNQRIASGFGAAGIKAVFDHFFSFRSPHSAVGARLEAAPARRSVSPSFTRRLGLPELPEPSKESIAADGGAWQGNQSIGSSRWRGSIVFKNRFARCARELNNRLEPIRRP